MLESLTAFLQRPFKAEMTALDWFLFIGLILAMMIAWRLILTHIVAEA